MAFPLSGQTRLVPILAWPVDHVRAPRHYNPAFAAQGLDWFQVPMGVHPDDLAATLAQLARVSNLQGVNLTIPHKAAAFALCTEVTAEAARTRMANTLRLRADGRWAGTNSDGAGFVGAARAHGLLDAARPVFIAGSGGAGTAIAFALAAEGVGRFTLTDADAARAQALAAALRRHFPALQVDAFAAAAAPAAALGGAALVVNATPLGLHAGEPMPLDPALLGLDAALFDIVAARDTELMAAVTARGLRVLGGGPMVEHQLAHQIAFWRGQAFPLFPGPEAAP